MRDVFNRECKEGDTVMFITSKSKLRLGIVVGFTKNSIKTVETLDEEMSDITRKDIKCEFLILKRADGETFFDSKGNKFKGWWGNRFKIKV